MVKHENLCVCQMSLQPFHYSDFFFLPAQDSTTVEDREEKVPVHHTIHLLANVRSCVTSSFKCLQTIRAYATCTYKIWNNICSKCPLIAITFIAVIVSVTFQNLSPSWVWALLSSYCNFPLALQISNSKTLRSTCHSNCLNEPLCKSFQLPEDDACCSTDLHK